MGTPSTVRRVSRNRGFTTKPKSRAFSTSQTQRLPALSGARCSPGQATASRRSVVVVRRCMPIRSALVVTRGSPTA